MQYSTHGSYRLEQQNNILLIDIDEQGTFNDVVSKQYHNDIKIITQKMRNNPWASLITFKGNGVFTPETEQNLIETTHYRVENGMVAIAAVIIDSAYADTLQMQLQRIYQGCSVQFYFFSDTKNAKIWLDSFIN
ncbi:hypothetical protein [Candidatus Colwellia aromaticivorans]|uniref:hypothetical protein n=1 Tax=Candidatus Colwellia aromaticivorans TaxID=2267621 RepID=UPI000DF3A2AE|nr:hypothetical protein [Candidatus Colwellia aromaticivorans]